MQLCVYKDILSLTQTQGKTKRGRKTLHKEIGVQATFLFFFFYIVTTSFKYKALSLFSCQLLDAESLGRLYKQGTEER